MGYNDAHVTADYISIGSGHVSSLRLSSPRFAMAYSACVEKSVFSATFIESAGHTGHCSLRPVDTPALFITTCGHACTVHYDLWTRLAGDSGRPVVEWKSAYPEMHCRDLLPSWRCDRNYLCYTPEMYKGRLLLITQSVVLSVTQPGNCMQAQCWHRLQLPPVTRPLSLPATSQCAFR